MLGMFICLWRDICLLNISLQGDRKVNLYFCHDYLKVAKVEIIGFMCTGHACPEQGRKQSYSFLCQDEIFRAWTHQPYSCSGLASLVAWLPRPTGLML